MLTTNFFGARHFVFRAGSGAIERQAGLFLASSVLFRGLEYVAFLIVHTVLGFQYVVAIVGILVTSMVVKFLWYRRVVFRSRPQREDPAVGVRRSTVTMAALCHEIHENWYDRWLR